MVFIISVSLKSVYLSSMNLQDEVVTLNELPNISLNLMQGYFNFFMQWDFS